MEPDILTIYRERIIAGLAAALHGEGALRGLLRYHVGLDESPGALPAAAKLLRPSLVLFTTEALGGSVECALGAAVGLELVHGFSLIHDDIQDRDPLRRGRPALWAICGVAEAINAGDLMHSLGIAEALRSSPESADCLLGAAAEMIEGQSDDLSFERRGASGDEYLAMIDRKTGALLRCAFELGGLAAGAPASVRGGLAELGRRLGRAFQIADDVLGVWGADDATGKPTGSDIKRCKRALPAVLLFERIASHDRDRLERLYGGSDRADGEEGLGPTDVAWVVERLREADVRRACERQIDRHLAEATAQLCSVPFAEPDRARMDRLIAYLARRSQ